MMYLLMFVGWDALTNGLPLPFAALVSFLPLFFCGTIYACTRRADIRRKDLWVRNTSATLTRALWACRNERIHSKFNLAQSNAAQSFSNLKTDNCNIYKDYQFGELVRDFWSSVCFLFCLLGVSICLVSSLATSCRVFLSICSDSKLTFLHDCNSFFNISR